MTFEESRPLVVGIERWSGEIRKTFLFLVIILISFPVPIRALAPGIDPSWMAGINWATAKQLVFGRDIVFTYGPLAFALCPVDCGTEN